MPYKVSGREVIDFRRDGYLTDFARSQYMTQGRLIVENHVRAIQPNNTHLVRTPCRPPENQERDKPVLSKQNFRQDVYWTDFPPSLYLTQSRFIEETHAQIKIHARVD